MIKSIQSMAALKRELGFVELEERLELVQLAAASAAESACQSTGGGGGGGSGGDSGGGCGCPSQPTQGS